MGALRNGSDREKWENALKAKGTGVPTRGRMGVQGGKGIAPNKAAGSKGGIRRQGSKRG